ncbi:hypothetical protein C8R44DRAFT_719616 [Mycena epipterygia]|nr:hypothetical protein C8R44DRAFT_719616 [Mycena epipterygia]
MPERIHFVRQSVHVMTHLGPEVIRLGPAALYSQWTMERTIGNLVQEIKLHSQPYANLSERGLRRSQVNALKAMIPDLHPEEQKLPRGSIDLGDGYVLLRARDEFRHHIDGNAGQAIRNYLEADSGPMVGQLSLIRWARVRLPNGQIARSLWKESRRPLKKVRMARNMKFFLNTMQAIAEIHFFFRAELDGEAQAFALVDLYSEPDEDLCLQSHNTVWSCAHGGGEHLRVITVKSIISVVAMVPHSVVPGGSERYSADSYFLVEKPGLDVMHLSGYQQPDAPDNEE